MQSRLESFSRVGARVIAVSPDAIPKNREVVNRDGLEFLVLSDRELEATRAFGLLHAGGGPRGADIPRPATFVIRDGKVRWRDLTMNYRVRPRPERLLSALRRVAGE